MNSIITLVVGALLGFGSNLLLDLTRRRAEFRGKTYVLIAKLEDSNDEDFASVYDATRLEALEAFAKVKPDIFCWKRSRFNSACFAYCYPEADDRKQFSDIVMHGLFPDHHPMPFDQRSPKGRRIAALLAIVSCVERRPNSFLKRKPRRL